MAVTYTDLTAETLPALQQFLIDRWRDEKAGPEGWPADFAARFFRWRFLDRKAWQTTIAMDGDRCVALMDSFLRDYLVNGRKMTVRENGVWWCHPDFRPLVAMRVLQMLMQNPEPVVIVGGGLTLQGVLKKYRWQSLIPVQHRVMVLGTGGLLKIAGRLVGADQVPLPPRLSRLISFNFKRIRPYAPEGASVDILEAPAALPAIEPPHDAYALAALANRDDAEWLMAAPEAEGRFRWLVFSERGTPIGFSVSRVYEENGPRTAKLLHVQVSQPDIDTYTWIIGETTRYLASQGANWIDTMMSCPEANAAMDRIGYMARPAYPSFWWSREEPAPSGKLHLTGLGGQRSLTPYPENPQDYG